MLLAAVSGATSRIRLGTTSYLLPLRHPLQAAEQVAVLDQLSGGRVILGVGRGYQESMFAAFNVERREKREIFEWCLGTMIAAWRGDSVTNDGAEVRLAPRPVQQPHPPVWVAAIGPKALAQAGRLGLPYLASPMETLDVLVDNYRRHRDACCAGTHAMPAEVPVMRSVFVSDDKEEVQTVRELLRKQASEARASGSPLVRRGAGDDVATWALVGGRAEVADGVARYVEELGMTHLVVTRLRIGGVPADALERSLHTFAELLGLGRGAG
jgi:alkanesulfonate monooxygenase SsuD/methylene tetrahydromethanopterin reductase-like flavin-dependent oxidoreductase (luciferase family)